MQNNHRTIPKPLVLLNQWFIVISVLITWFSGSHYFLMVPLLAGIFGLVFKFNPVIKFGALLLRKEPQSYFQEDWNQQQFNQMIAVLCLGLSLGSFSLGWNISGYIFSAMVAAAAFVAILGFCIGCFIRFQWQQYQYRKSISN
ncbi:MULTISPECIES: DUF4395 domain-containing protein [unclassified Bacillus (in: firmicutes)]|uniref:DUF4395 domain-containing protein n=1 Tax=unclassified Bacillus (in: firmicutes) TaxID=185979 RepID=UPI0008EF8D86|nr:MULTISPECIES: DUF4395 domain-containing protein [unclassified Bacillus (in: firmicutes)]SFA88097.1 protein of unknown function [Bacillus sp. UNCCL13]SFQ84508.1 protein of unknown function [Bacillus sp. cl95]